ncbi:hypothetical protein, partial [Elizabethkingia argenteiflava]|uniref:hypothetical protein n=1 Tax=Elizabethkingia argenteiflava TaxID=2681556 RepID=UPI001BB40EF7
MGALYMWILEKSAPELTCVNKKLDILLWKLYKMENKVKSPRILLVGNPNVVKSTLFNQLC